MAGSAASSRYLSSFCRSHSASSGSHATAPSRIIIFCSPFRYRMRSGLLSESCLSVGTVRSTAILALAPSSAATPCQPSTPFDRVRYHHFQLLCERLHQLVNDFIMPLLVKRPHVGTYDLRLLPAHPAGRTDVHT